MRKMRQRLLSMFTFFVLVTGMTFVMVTPAHASFDWCHGSSVACFAEHTNGNGYRWGPRSFPYGVCVNVPSGINDKISSLWNKYGWDSQSPPLQLTGYEHNCGNSFQTVLYTWGPSAYVLDIGFQNRDRMSAVCIGPRQQGYCP